MKYGIFKVVINYYLTFQLIMASIFGITFMCCGMSLGHSAVLLPELQKNGSGIHIDDNTASLIGSPGICYIEDYTRYNAIF